MGGGFKGGKGKKGKKDKKKKKKGKGKDRTWELEGGFHLDNDNSDNDKDHDTNQEKGKKWKPTTISRNILYNDRKVSSNNIYILYITCANFMSVPFHLNIMDMNEI